MNANVIELMEDQPEWWIKRRRRAGGAPAGGHLSAVTLLRLRTGTAFTGSRAANLVYVPSTSE